MKNRFLFSLSILLGLGLVGISTAWAAAGGRENLAAPALTTWYVDAASGDDGNDCLTPITACATVAEAITRSLDLDTIQIAAGVYDEPLDVSKSLTLVGAGSGSTFLDGAGSHRVLQASSAGGLSLSDLTIRNGNLAGENGAGVYNLGLLTLTNVQVVSNTTDSGGAGIFNNGGLILADSQVLSNTSQGVGGGLYIWYQGVVTVTGSVIAGNSGHQGGGVYTLDTLRFEDVILGENSAVLFGGGLTMFDGSVEMLGATVHGNQTPGYGAGIVNNQGALTLTNVTISGNTGDNYGGLANISSAAQTTLLNSTIANNFVTGPGVRYGGVGNLSDAVISFKNTLVADNEGRNCLASGTWTSLGHNLSSDTFCSFTATGDLQSVDPQLAPLGDYGGGTWTQALNPGSPAIDAGDNAGCPAVDQRGVARPVDGDGQGMATCDIGAFEARHQIAVGDVSITEGDGGFSDAVFTVSLAPTGTQTITVEYATADGTAMAGFDYLAASGVLAFSPGQLALTVTVPVSGDLDDEPDEIFYLNLTDAVNADIVDPQGQATIIDDDGLSSLTVADQSVDEGNSGTVDAAFVVSLSPAASQVVTVNYATAEGTAQAGDDYQAVSGVLTFNPGETSQGIDVSVLGDLVDEGASETFNLVLSSPTNANLADPLAEGTIMDDDTARLSLSAPVTVIEGDSGSTPAIFTVTLSTPAAFTVTVDFASSSGTGGTFATPGVDYLDASGSLNFPPGENERSFSVLVLGDLEIEPQELFSVLLSNAQPVTILVNSSLGFIQDDDGSKIFLPLVLR